MSEAKVVPGLSEYLLPGAPKDQGRERRCEMGYQCRTYAQCGQIGKLHRYRRRMASDLQGPQGLLLCNLCARDWQDNEMVKARKRELKRAERENTIMLPGLSQARRTYSERNGQSKLSQDALAAMVGCTDSQISALEREKYGAPESQARLIADALGVSLDELVRVKENA